MDAWRKWNTPDEAEALCFRNAEKVTYWKMKPHSVDLPEWRVLCKNPPVLHKKQACGIWKVMLK